MAVSEKLVKAQSELTDINVQIDNHPLNSSALKDAREVVAEHREAGKDAVEVALAERGLPSAAAQGKALVLGVTSMWNLNRKRVGLENRIRRLDRL
ncbi:hypothetical protein B7495_16925 [Cryobacterium sp. LW097]|uniref:hypothetical protein n=1 Tax=unclassified Cryobacterium TaxID=2649013 RepID=UPI000B4C6663|nr:MULTISPECIES: hypothetical protein [unclassified Cryobacterium]ASD23595.1 hypothetical protein B7495_16925 [Cryobacterium sp. LW097]TFC54745.1 hypothetical protein E3O68_09010 [Cryobacterium sp. TMB3-1-2]TFC71482.1 hypothetical protein E3T21_07680 [Cryobacterium sp. TMB3-15]TFC72293.1 hypothetical protein E3T22_18245 [Cryobacterium sp. TMB3-10]TFD42469.1 hypothetical protein E3T58_08740 [Cryobacterium sp. TMB3-12]